MFGSGSLIAGKIAYAVACAGAAVVLVVSGYAHQVVGLTKSLGGGVSIGNSSSVGAMNVLLMGLESRTDFHGNTLSGGLLAAMHAGSVNGVENQGVGGQATNTLILIHIFAGGQKAVGFSIPRDDYVTYPQAYDGQSAGKIDEAYGLAYAQSLSATVNDTSLSHDQRYLTGQPGRARRPRSPRWSRSPGRRSTTSPRSTWPGSTTWPRPSTASRPASSRRPGTRT